MAAVQKKGRNSKDGDRKESSKRLEDTPSIVENKEDSSENKVETPLFPDDQPSPVTVESVPPKPPSPEPVYEEPVLTQLIVESFEGETLKGLYEGEGETNFVGGHYYKGQFSEGLMHGNGYYKWSDGLTYEGEFTKNKVTGKGLYTWPDGSTYEGDVFNGLRHGYGTFTCAKLPISYTGQWLSGKRHGKGRVNYDASGLSFYEGDLVNNTRHGFGTRQYPSGNVYQGMWFNNVRHGEGTMRWLDKDQMYTGHWEDGIQHGSGQHIWFLHRVAGSQYPLRNTYDGEFVQGLRNGYGTFYFANGARYEGQWLNNMKHGKGKFVFKNGRVYEGVFEKDHIMEYPTFTIDGVSTPDLTQIRTRTPLPSEQMSISSNESRNTYGPSFQLEVEHLLQEFTETDREEEATQVIFVIMRYITKLRSIYNFYSALGYEDSPDNTFIMSRMQFWRFLKDCRLHQEDITLSQMDRVLATDLHAVDEIHNPYTKILYREFLNHLVTLSYHIYSEDHTGTGPVLSWCLSKLISDNILRHACKVQGHIYTESRRAVNALVHLDQAYEVYKSLCFNRKYSPKEPTMTMRQFLFMIKDLRLVNSDLSPKRIIEVLACDDPSVAHTDGSINLQLEMTFLEFLEGLVGCAAVFVTESVVKDPTTPRPSTTLTAEQSLVSMTASPSRMASQVGLDEGEEEEVATSSPNHHVTQSEAPTPTPRAASASSHKTADRSTKPLEQQISNMTAGSSSEAGGHSHHTHLDSAKKSDMTLAGPKKSASFLSDHSGVTDGDGQFIQSVVSVGGGHSEVALDDHTEVGDDDEEELDEATRQFNFWTHQVHIFFVRKFFPAAQHHAIITQLVQDRVPTPPEVTPEYTSPVLPPEVTDSSHLVDITEASKSVMAES